MSVTAAETSGATPGDQPARPRRERPRTTFVVTGTTVVSPSLVRVALEAEDREVFADRFGSSAFTDRYAKLVFPRPDDSEVVRTYTVLDIDTEAGTMAVEFVVHGSSPDDEAVDGSGVAGAWASAAQPGDRLSMMGPGGAFAPDPEADWHLFAGDEAGLPAIRAALAALPDDAVARVVLLAPAGHEVDLPQTSDTEVTWVASDLADAVRRVEWLPGRVQCFVHGEAEAVMHGVRPYLLKERGLPREDVSISGYWRAGRTEEGFRAWKRDLAATEGD